MGSLGKNLDAWPVVADKVYLARSPADGHPVRPGLAAYFRGIFGTREMATPGNAYLKGDIEHHIPPSQTLSAATDANATNSLIRHAFKA